MRLWTGILKMAGGPGMKTAEQKAARQEREHSVPPAAQLSWATRPPGLRHTGRPSQHPAPSSLLTCADSYPAQLFEC